MSAGLIGYWIWPLTRKKNGYFHQPGPQSSNRITHWTQFVWEHTLAWKGPSNLTHSRLSWKLTPLPVLPTPCQTLEDTTKSPRSNTWRPFRCSSSSLCQCFLVAKNWWYNPENMSHNPFFVLTLSTTALPQIFATFSFTAAPNFSPNTFQTCASVNPNFSPFPSPCLCTYCFFPSLEHLSNSSPSSKAQSNGYFLWLSSVESYRASGIVPS